MNQLSLTYLEYLSLMMNIVDLVKCVFPTNVIRF